MKRLALTLLAFAVLALGLPSVGNLDPIGPTATAAADAPADGEKGYAKQDGPVASIPQGIWSAGTAIIVFLIVSFILMTQVWPKITAGLDDRANKIRSEIEGAEAARAQAKSALEEYEKSLTEARAESQKMLEETKAKQTALANELRAKADQELNQMRERAMRDIETAKKAALNEMYAESVTLATVIASKILAREVTPSDQDRLVEESLNELKAAASSN
ncbi:MAG: F0F1 ATP synthase subunit B [Planctomycetota bacterium]